MGSSQTRAQTHVPCIGRRILNHCATREISILLFKVTVFHRPHHSVLILFFNYLRKRLLFLFPDSQLCYCSHVLPMVGISNLQPFPWGEKNTYLSYPKLCCLNLKQYYPLYFLKSFVQFHLFSSISASLCFNNHFASLKRSCSVISILLTQVEVQAQKNYFLFCL